MNRKYVILTQEPPARRTRGGRAGAAPSATTAPTGPKVEVDEISASSAAALSRQRNTTVAPIMPMRLIAPVANDVQAEPAAATNAWGITATGADKSPFTGDGVVVAVLDTGIDPNHPAFQGVQLVRKNFTTSMADDEHGHGTHCAGTIFGRDVAGTRIGVARGVKKAVIGKVLGAGGGGSHQIVQAIQWAVNEGANVISMSLGIDFPGYVKELEGEGVPTEAATSMALEDYRANVTLFERMAALLAAQNAFMQGALIIAAAGNESERDGTPNYEIAVSPPAVADGIISVAALAQGTQGFIVAPFSNAGARISGPGVAVKSAKRGGGLVAMSGTSMATPHVAGIAALWAQKLNQSGQMSGQLLADRLVGNASTSGMKAGFDPHDIGAGMVQAPLA